ncbi:hypothetical protein BDN72DRAFT_849974, partial [Pluteus cervinus]
MLAGLTILLSRCATMTPTSLSSGHSPCLVSHHHHKVLRRPFFLPRRCFRALHLMWLTSRCTSLGLTTVLDVGAF